MTETSRTQWQLPDGVDSGTWDYAQSTSIADDYDDYFADHPLFALDENLISQHLNAAENESSQKTIADLGCGTARALMPFVARGFRGLAVDLSLPMLMQVRSKTKHLNAAVLPIHANLVQLDGLRDACVDYAISLFSTLGMIRGRAHRREALAHSHRILRPGGLLFVHVHNTWAALADPSGPAWLFSSWKRSLSDRTWEFGDRVYQYRGLPNMFLHNYRHSELKSDIQSAGFAIDAVLPLNARASGRLKMPKLLPSLRAGGFIAICRRDR